MASNVFLLHHPGGPPREAQTTEVIPAPAQPLAVARVLLREVTTDDDHLLLRKWRGDFYKYVGPQWVVADPDGVRKWLYERLEHCKYERYDPKTKQVDLSPWAPDKAKLDRLIDAMIAPTLLDRDLQAPIWLSTGKPATGYVPCLNGLVDVNTQQVIPATPDYFGTVAIPFDYDSNVGEPVQWLKFLRGLWPPDDLTELGYGQIEAEEIRTLRQWFGYVLSGRLDLQKMLLLMGPPRCGKGTIARILQALVGHANCSAPTVATLAQNFGLETSIGKALMVIGDARLPSHGQEAVVERLLSISGQDTLTLDRKNRAAWTGTMQTRVMILSNEVPRLGDASGAIASRFVILKFSRSFLGKEDVGLEDRLRAELPAILKWALDGLRDLQWRQRICEPEAHHDALQEMYDLVSPISAFVRDVCDTRPAERGQEKSVPFADLYAEYCAWCEENTRGKTNTARFSADLKAWRPELKTDYRPRDERNRKLPRHVRGLTISAEWRSRVRSTRDAYDANWHRREPPGDYR